MTYENKSQLDKWIEEFQEDKSLTFESYRGRQTKAVQIEAALFLYRKLKPKNKDQDYFFHGEHDVLFIGSSFEIFEDFTQGDAKDCVRLGISICDEYGEGFRIYASM